jgi:zinc protease
VRPEPNAHEERASTTLPAHEGLVRRTLDNGAEILVLPTDRPAGGLSGGGVVAVQLWVLGGTNAERAHEHGCAHLLEHLLFKPATVDGGATSDLAKAIEALGGDVNAYTSHDETVFHATVPAPGVLAAIDGLLGPVLSPRFDPAELRAEIEVVVEEILQDKDDPSARLSQDVAAALFSGHGYGRPVLGTVSSVRGHDAKTLRAFHRRVYAGRRLRLVVVGPVDPRPVLARARPWLSPRTRGGSVPEGQRLVTARTRPFVRVRRLDVLEAHFQIGWTAPPLPAADACALELASVVLGYGEASRLSTRVRRKARAVTDAYASLYGSRVASSVVVGGHAPPGSAVAAVERVLDEIEALAVAPLSHEEIERAKAVVKSDVVYRRETGAGQAHALGYFLSIGGGLDAEARYFRHVDALRPEDVMKACARWLGGPAAALAVAVPESVKPAAAREWAAELRKRLARKPAGPRKARRAAHRKSGIVSIDHDSGVRVRALVDRRVPIAAGWLMWPGGLRLETEETHGSSAMMAKLLTRGCADLDGDALAREIEGRAAVLDGFCGRHSAGLHFESVAPDFDHVLRRALECATGPTFAATELAEERRVVLESLAAEADDLGKVAMRTVLSVLYRGHPYRLRRRGNPASLRAMTSPDLAKRWPAWYPISRAVLGLCGDLDLDRIVAVLDGELSGVPAHVRSQPKWPKGKVERGHRARVLRRAGGRDREQVHLAVGYPGLSFRDDRIATLDVLVAILGGQVGRLFTALREREGLVYHVSATAAHGVDAGDVLVYAATGRDKVDRALAAVRAQLSSVAHARVGTAELEHARAYLRGQYDAELERRSRVASLLALDEAFDLGPGAFSRYPKDLEAVTQADVLALSQALFDPRLSVTAIVG